MKELDSVTQNTCTEGLLYSTNTNSLRLITITQQQNRVITMFNEMAPENCFSLCLMEPTDLSRLIVGKEDMMKVKVHIYVLAA